MVDGRCPNCRRDLDQRNICTSCGDDWSDIISPRRISMTDSLPMQPGGDWFTRNADRRNPKAFVNTNPTYFGSECADAIMNGTLSTRPAPASPLGLVEWESPLVQKVYAILCDGAEPESQEEHWEGWIARRIVAALSPDARVEGEAVALMEELRWLHEAARGATFDLTPADGPIARLALFMHENGDRLIEALSTRPAPASPPGLVEAAQRVGALPAGFLHKPGIEWVLLDGTELTDDGLLALAALSPDAPEGTERHLCGHCGAQYLLMGAGYLDLIGEALDAAGAPRKSPDGNEHYSIFSRIDALSTRPAPASPPGKQRCPACHVEFERIDNVDAHLAALSPDAGVLPIECPSCHGLNTSCPDGCGRDPETGELNGTRLSTPATEWQQAIEAAAKVADDLAQEWGERWKAGERSDRLAGFSDGANTVARCIRALKVSHPSTVKLELGKLEADYAIPMILFCPSGHRHIDEQEFADAPHHTHACQTCGIVWRPAKVNTHGVQFLPGYRNEDTGETR